MSGAAPAPWAERLVAHRGHARVCPENTLSAVKSALEAGARYLEVDVQLAADGVPHLFHDRTLERLCGVRGQLAELDTAALAKLRAAERGRFGSRFADEPVATLEALVELLARPEASAARVFVELKRAAIEAFGPERVLLEVLPRLEPIARRALLISFDLGVLELARRRSELPLGPVLEDWQQRETPRIARLVPEVVFCDAERLPRTGALVAHAPLVVYEVAEAGPARALIARGAERIETFALGELLAELERGPPPPGADGNPA
jgi:glycerophosphoryl diester phosphodiesterase